MDDQPRQQGKTGRLPSARAVSRAVHQGNSAEKTDRDISSIFTFWGQFMAHMISDRAVATGYNSTRVDCCSQDVPTPRSECFNIDIPEGDPFRKDGRTCLGFLRSMETTTMGCVTGQREQLNLASSYIDGSAVYGSDKEKVEYLRRHHGGELWTSEPNELPHKSHPNAIAEKMGLAFARAGDPRAPEVPMLTGIHTIWLREHNRIARELAVINRFWDDEKLYQESRRIVAALIQHITYSEWLPVLLGPAIVKDYDLLPRVSGFYTEYDPAVDASTTNVVSTAAFRFGHSLITASFPLCKKDFTQGSSPALKLGDMFFRSNQYLLHEQGLMRGLLTKPAASMDAIVTNDLTNKLFKTHQGNGGDLVAFNIQRGRDHGLPSYNSWRTFTGLPSASSFTGASGFVDIPEDTVQALASVYGHPDDVDIWTGGVSERPVPGGLLGPVFSHLLARQFSRYRQGDRFWYETSEEPQGFTAAQLKQIRMMTFARIMCNSFDVDMIQSQAFRMASTKG
ncbi:peroxidase-like protein 3 [Liolophura sinensis]|uniref:peroxidase-like protein 3 n=1 Tax=Liolophura sinensis TaxID=3198878 RepID=UPI003158FDBB